MCRKDCGTIIIGNSAEVKYSKDRCTLVKINGELFSFGFDYTKRDISLLYNDLTANYIKDRETIHLTTLLYEGFKSISQINAINYFKNIFSIDKIMTRPNKVYGLNKTWDRKVLNKFTSSEIMRSNFLDKTEKGNLFYTFFVCINNLVYAVTYVCKTKDGIKLDSRFNKELHDLIQHILLKSYLATDIKNPVFHIKNILSELLNTISSNTYLNSTMVSDFENGSFILNIHRLEKNYVSNKRDR